MKRCSVEGCDTTQNLRRGWCVKHYQRWRRHGDPLHERENYGNPQHGTENMYGNHHCRCDECKTAHAVYTVARNHRLGYARPRDVVFAERRAAALAKDNHGTAGRYKLGCRCDICREFARVDRARRRAQVPAEQRRAFEREYKRAYRARVAA